MQSPTRREFLVSATAGGLGGLSFLNQLQPVSAAEAKLDTKIVMLRPEMEPIVRLIEKTPRGQLLELVADRIRKGLSYRELLAALLLAGVRNVQPRPSVGFKFHAVLVVNSAHLASISSPDTDRWLPIFWALDAFKSSQARDVQEGNWTMAPVKESAVPPGHKAHDAFTQAMNRWDVEAADAAIAGLARGAGANRIFELFAHYGPRDFRSIGHKAIFVANSWRTLQVIGWQHAEPVLRSLAYALLNHRGEPNPADNNLDPDKPWRRNLELVKKIRTGWQEGKASREATLDMLKTLRTESDEDACKQVVGLLNRGVSPQSVYDGMQLGAGELLMRQPGIVALHAVTSTNALRYIFRSAANDETRRMVLLQNAAFLPLFREAMKGRGKVGNSRIDQMEPAKVKGDKSDAVNAVFGAINRDRAEAARQMLGCLDAGIPSKSLIDTARRLIFIKGTNSHDYKFSSAVLEDYHHLAPEWRNWFLAASVYNLRGSGGRDNPLVKRTREAFKA